MKQFEKYSLNYFVVHLVARVFDEKEIVPSISPFRLAISEVVGRRIGLYSVRATILLLNTRATLGVVPFRRSKEKIELYINNTYKLNTLTRIPYQWAGNTETVSFFDFVYPGALIKTLNITLRHRKI